MSQPLAQRRNARGLLVWQKLLVLVVLSASCSSPLSDCGRNKQTQPPAGVVDINVLPNPTAPAGLSPDEDASQLATLVRRGGRETLPALTAALPRAGIPLTATAASSTPSGSRAFAIEPWEVHALTGLEASQVRFSLEDLANALAAATPQLASGQVPVETTAGDTVPEPLGYMILEEITSGWYAEDSTTRFWAHFVNRAGRRLLQTPRLTSVATMVAG